MIIENPDVFKSWLTSILEPLCDADPAALAKYVYALVKKEKPLQELRDGMLDQLDVFLQHETKPFVDMLFKSLETHDYLIPSDKLLPSLPETTDAEKELENDDNHVPIPPAINGTSMVPDAIAPPIPGLQDAPEAPAPELRRQRVVMSRGAPKMAARAPPLEQTLVKVLPLTELLEEPVDHPPRRRDRRADSLRDKEERRRRRSRSWERRPRARRPRDAHDERRYERRAASKSPSPRGRYRNRSPPQALMDRIGTRSKSRSPVSLRERDLERERLRVPRELERERMSRDREHKERLLSRDRDRSRSRSRERSRGSGSPRERSDHNDAHKRRCRDFDEKGYCMRGDLCQWDHGTDPLVLEDAALTRVLTVPPAVPEYNPLTPDIWCAPPFAPFPPLHAHHPPRELIPIPSTFPHRMRMHPPRPPGLGPPAALPAPAPRQPHPHRKQFDSNRLGAPRPPMPANVATCSLEVKKVPRGLNDIMHLNNHFCKFGKIVNIQVCFEGDPEAALVTFASPTEANVAYKSTEAVLNNRFIKVFWHNPENKQENMAPGGQQRRQNEKQNEHMSHNKVLINRDNIKATADIKQQLADKQAKENTNGQEKKKEVTKLDKSKQVMEMMKRAQALLEKQLQQQLLLIKKLESGNISESQKAALLEAIKSAQEGIEKLRNELFAYNGTLMQMQGETVARSMSRLQLQVNAKRPKTRQEAEKEILDAELDLFTKQQEGQDVTELAKKVAELRRTMVINFPPHPVMRRPHSRGGRFNTMSRFTRGGVSKVFSQNQSVDHRPRALLVSGFEADELDALVQHFMQFGEVTSKEVNLSVPELVVQYKARAHAEQAAAQGKHYNDRTLCITWAANTKPPAPAAPAPPASNGDAAEKEPESSTQDVSQEAAALLRFDEEEEEDADEERSWRR